MTSVFEPISVSPATYLRQGNSLSNSSQLNKAQSYQAHSSQTTFAMSVCRYFNTPRGCKNNPCRFLHQISTSDPPGGPSSPASPTRVQPPRPSLQLSAPRGVCRYFFTYGNCKLTDCKFRHVEPDGVAPNFVPNPGGTGGGDQISRTVIFQKVSAADALRHLENFCAPRVVFSKPFQFNTFVNLLANAGSKEGSWVSLLSTMGQHSFAYMDVRIWKTLTVFLTWSLV